MRQIAGVDVSLILALAGIGIAVSLIATGRWTNLKRAYTVAPQ